jgi:hypothetical protein
MDHLIEAYLKWKYQQFDTATSCTSHIQSPIESLYDFTMETVDIYSLQTSTLIRRSENCKSAAIALVDCGYLGTSPNSLTLAISLKTLELYRRIQLRKPSFSVEAFVKVICDLYMVCSVKLYPTLKLI